MSFFAPPSSSRRSTTPRRKLPSLTIPLVPENNTSAVSLTADSFSNGNGNQLTSNAMDTSESQTLELYEHLKDKNVHQLNEEEWKLLAQNDLIETIEVLGEGNTASVEKCRLKTTGYIFALKTITLDPSPEIQRQILRELNFNKSCRSPYIVEYYGTYFNESNATINICMEYMGGISLDGMYRFFRKHDGRIGEKPLGKVAESVLSGLTYLNQQKIMHRDIKPQNILLDHEGNVKICDLGVSGEVVNSLASTFTGTSYYMAPERIKSEAYTITSDVWSLGITLLEGCVGHLPFITKEDSLKENVELSPVELLQMILNLQLELEDEPEENIFWSSGFKNFLKIALIKESMQRPSPRQMLDHPWLLAQKSKKVRMDKLIQHCCQ